MPHRPFCRGGRPCPPATPPQRMPSPGEGGPKGRMRVWSTHPNATQFVTAPRPSSVTASPCQLPRRGSLWADEYPQGAGRICNAPSSRTAALGIGPYTVRWKLAGTGGQGRPPLQSVPHRQRREIFCQKKARGRRRIGYTSSPQQRTSGRKDPSLDYSGLICSITKHSKMSPSLMSLNFSIDIPHS